jgi:hypothetical protein
MDYTKFHIGMYTTIFSALVAFLQYKDPVFWVRGCLGFAIVCFMTAGAAGGVIGSNIPNYESMDDFKKADIGPWGLSWLNARMKYENWAHLEHAAFWLGAVVAVFGFVFGPPSPPRP